MNDRQITKADLDALIAKEIEKYNKPRVTVVGLQAYQAMVDAGWICENCHAFKTSERPCGYCKTPVQP